jgi:hypothetical protein
LIGLPSRTFTRTPQAALHPPHVDAYQLATPGVSSGDLFRNGMIFCSGARQLASATAAAEKPIICKKPLRDTPLFNSV